jgi:predicted O-methyltransferase YrrM
MDLFNYYNSFLPNQKLLKKYFNVKSISAFEKKLFNFIMYYSDITSPRKKFKIYNPTKFSIEEMASNPISINFLKSLITLTKPKNILEVGCFVGVTTMEIASILKPESKITTVEKFSEFARVAEINFKKNKLNKVINLVNQDVKIFLSETKKKYDLIFIDGDKENYLEIFLESEKLLSKKGFIIIDNIFNQGDSLNDKPITSKGFGVVRVLKYLKKRKDLKKCILPFYDGIMLVQKLSSKFK